jgi:ABC-type phosphate transport system substrate-binding protein
MMSRLTFLACLLACLLGPVRSLGAEAVGYRVIVNAKNQQGAVDRRFLAQAFLKKATVWGDGELIRPVDLPADSGARRRFTDEVLERTVTAVKSYWQQIIFSGRGVPPPELDSDDAVIRYVLRYPGALGYVSAGADLHGVKVLAVK